jgi:hypothetical protein
MASARLASEVFRGWARGATASIRLLQTIAVAQEWLSRWVIVP